MVMVPKATDGQFDVNGSEAYREDNLMLMVPKATERQLDVNDSEGY